jgi:hypothetical protein
LLTKGLKLNYKLNYKGGIKMAIKEISLIYLTLSGDKAKRAQTVKDKSKLSHPAIYMTGVDEVEKKINKERGLK